MAAHWLVKQEPASYPFAELVADRKTCWDGVRNYQARNNLRDMKRGDLVLYYHSNEGKEVVGIAEIVGEGYPDPTADDPQWVVVDIVPIVPFTQPVTLKEIKADPKLPDIKLVTRGRLSVVPLTSQEFRHVAKRGKTKVPPLSESRANEGVKKKAANH